MSLLKGSQVEFYVGDKKVVQATCTELKVTPEPAPEYKQESLREKIEALKIQLSQVDYGSLRLNEHLETHGYLNMSYNKHDFFKDIKRYKDVEEMEKDLAAQNIGTSNAVFGFVYDILTNWTGKDNIVEAVHEFLGMMNEKPVSLVEFDDGGYGINLVGRLPDNVDLVIKGGNE
jgi:hypothetical protein